MRRKNYLSTGTRSGATAEPDKIHEVFALPKDVFTSALTCFLSPGRGHCCGRFLNIWMLVARTLLTVYGK
jgi:hypothetical protein